MVITIDNFDGIVFAHQVDMTTFDANAWELFVIVAIGLANGGAKVVYSVILSLLSFVD